jgi:hypothetical protein
MSALSTLVTAAGIGAAVAVVSLLGAIGWSIYRHRSGN